MAIPSFDNDWRDGERQKPRIQVLGIRHRDQPDREPLAWIVVERQETYRRDPRDNSIYEATLRLSYERLHSKHSRWDGGRGHFDGSYSKLFDLVSLTSSSTSKGAVFLDLPGLEGHRIGTYLMNEVVAWVKQWPEATVRSVELVSGQAHDENKERRNRFYEQFGLVFDYSDNERREGRSRPMPARDLAQVETWKANIREHRFDEYLSAVLYEKERISTELEQRQLAIANLLVDHNRAEAAPLRWALQRLWWRYQSAVIGGAIVLGLGLLAWARSRAGA